MSRGKSLKMQEIEARFGRELEDLLPDLVNEHGQAGAADLLGIANTSLGYWLQRCNIVVMRVALRPDEQIQIVTLKMKEDSPDECG